MDAAARVYFDESLPKLVECVEKILPDSLGSGVILRDASGTLSFFVDTNLTKDRLETCSRALRRALGPYARPDLVLADRQAPGASLILSSNDIRLARIREECVVRVIDRRIVGSDWLLAPKDEIASPPRIVFASLKGGVGKSTALAVLAAEEAREGRNVLVIDLDLEAPGIGTMLLDAEQRPKLGVVDYLVESRLREIDNDELQDFVGVSRLTTGAGLVEVVPGIGTLGLASPQDFMSKLSRAMLEGVGPDSAPDPLRCRMDRMVGRLASRRSYDLILIDARAGLSELAPGPLFGFGAIVLLFGTAQRQTLEGYRALFAHLASFIKPGQAPSWRQRLKMVRSKATLSEVTHDCFVEDLWELFLEYLYEEADGIKNFSYDVRDPSAPHQPLVIPLDPRFSDWDPVARRTELTRSFYEATFGRFVTGIHDLLSLVHDPSSPAEEEGQL